VRRRRSVQVVGSKKSPRRRTQHERTLGGFWFLSGGAVVEASRFAERRRALQWAAGGKKSDLLLSRVGDARPGADWFTHSTLGTDARHDVPLQAADVCPANGFNSHPS